jgi:hypothetical protein
MIVPLHRQTAKFISAISFTGHYGQNGTALQSTDGEDVRVTREAVDHVWPSLAGANDGGSASDFRLRTFRMIADQERRR